MTKKKRGHPDIDEVLARPWCYYCERDFDDLKILINHQKAKHFKCDRCGRRLNTAGGLNVHMNQVHKENLTAIENALPNRVGLDVEIFGMEGIPEDIVQQHHQRVLTNYHQAEAERRAATGNPAPGAAGSNAVKKPKFESPAELKKRLAEHKAAKLAAEQNGGGSSGASTPVAGQAQSVNPQQSPANPSTYPPYQQSYAPPPSSTTFAAPTTYGQAPSQPFSPTYGAPPPNYAHSAPSAQPPFGQPPQNYPPMFGLPPQPSFQQPPYPMPNAYSPPSYQGQVSFPNQAYPPQVPQNGFQGQVGVPRAYNSASPASPFPHQQRTHSPAQSGLPQRPSSGSLPVVSGLPQRPAVSAPPVNAAQFQQMHQGQISTQSSFSPQTQLSASYAPPSNNEYNPAAPHIGLPQNPANDNPTVSSIDDLIANASKQADANAAANVQKANAPQPPSAPSTAKEEQADDKTAKKEKDKDKTGKTTRLVYSDNEISPEEKMATMSKYAFTLSQKSIQV